MTHGRITSLEHLARLADAGDEGAPPLEVLLFLGANGSLFSRKHIQYSKSRNGRHWWVEHSIDDTGGYYTDRQLREHTHIVTAIEHGALFYETEEPHA